MRGITMRLTRRFARRGLSALAGMTTALLVLGVPVSAAETRDQATTDVVATMQSQPDLGTFVRLLDSTGLSDTLRSSASLTIWAPTDAAFSKLPPGQLNGLVAQPAVLRDVLSYHLAPMPITAAQIVQVPTVKTVQGEVARITASGGAVHINDTTVIRADLLASNGIIHVIDGVLVPPSRVGTLPRTGDVPNPAPVLVAISGLLVALGLTLRLRFSSRRIR